MVGCASSSLQSERTAIGRMGVPSAERSSLLTSSWSPSSCRQAGTASCSRSELVLSASDWIMSRVRSRDESRLDAAASEMMPSSVAHGQRLKARATQRPSPATSSA
eukprot:7278404-Prymnesium_polylepis.2